VDHEADEPGEHGARPDAGQRHADGQAHGQHRPEGQDEDEDGEGHAEGLGAGRLELGEGGAADLDLQPVDLDLVDVVADGLADVDEIGLLDLGAEVDGGVGDLVGVGPLGGDLAFTPLVVGAGDPDDAVDLGDLAEQLLHGRLDLGVVDPLVGLEDDRPAETGTLTPEGVLEDVGAALGLDVGQ
jgi:hypothetical protein